jgi:hypothetical protein
MTPAAYKELVEHAGYQRAIIHRNPPLIDDEGYGVDSDDDEERVQEAIAEAAEADPYSSINLERASSLSRTSGSTAHFTNSSYV